MIELEVSYEGSDLAVVEEDSVTYLIEENTNESDEGSSFTVLENGAHLGYKPEEENVLIPEAEAEELSSYDEVVGAVLDTYRSEDIEENLQNEEIAALQV